MTTITLTGQAPNRTWTVEIDGELAGTLRLETDDSGWSGFDSEGTFAGSYRTLEGCLALLCPDLLPPDVVPERPGGKVRTAMQFDRQGNRQW